MPRLIEDAFLYQEHVRLCMLTGARYAVPVSVAANGCATYWIMQNVTQKPANNKYMERCSGCAADQWHDHVGVLLYGSYVRAPGPSHNRTGKPLALADDFQFVAGPSAVEKIRVDTFFKYDFENIYQVTQVREGYQLSM